MSNEIELMEIEYAEQPSANGTADKAIVISNFQEVVASVMNEAQFAILSGRTPKSVIQKRPGKGGKIFSYVPHGYVTSSLNKAFGFHWSFEILANGNGERFLLMEGRETLSNGKTVKTPSSILVTGRLTCYIHDPEDKRAVIATIVKESTGEKEFLAGMTWGAMVKSAESDALKRCAARLGIGNDLYWQDVDEVEEVDELTSKVRELQSAGKSISESAKVLGISVPETAKRRT